jgi:2-polyprenyl-3-methyl-5-hydroxy-6-metoxy-1,4-benzoquinol methylase
MADERLADLLARLERERAAADAEYHAALTALDGALQRVPEIPHPPPPYDERQIAPINQAWDILPAGAPATDGSLKGRLRAFIWRLVGPALEQQKHFNAALVDHLNRNVAAHREAERAIATTIALVREHIEGVVRVQHYLISYLQTITLYIDSKDRVAGGQAQVLNAALSALTDDWLKRWESLASREQRYDARTTALTRAYEELREAVALAQQTAASLRRMGTGTTAPAGTPGVSEAGSAPDSSSVPAGIYVGFEDRFRGSQEDIRSRLEDYPALFDGCTDVVDIGCGRGELLDLLRQRGVDARGVDLNEEMIEVCRGRGLAAEQGDALSYVLEQPDASLGGLLAIQVVEHLEPGYLLRFLEAAWQKLRPGAVMVLETINAACWSAFFESYIRDLSHVRPLHPDTLKYLVQASGFSRAEVQYRAPVPEADKLQRVLLPAPAPGTEHDSRLVDLVDAVNGHAEKLNVRLFTFMDYAVIARR